MNQQNYVIRSTQRFWSKVKKTDSCWNWIGYIHSDGYGGFWINGKTKQAHRIAYELIKGKIPNGLQLDHLCRNRKCVNPDHLEPVTARENILRGEGQAFVNSNKTHCKRGHKFTKNNTYQRNGKRHCRTCRNSTMSKLRKERKLIVTTNVSGEDLN